MDEIDYQRLAAVEMLASGQATFAEVAVLARTSRQLVRFWAKMAEVDVHKARAQYLAKAWQKAVRNAK